MLYKKNLFWLTTLYTFGLIFLALSVFSQKKAYKKSGDKAFENGNFYGASLMYREYLKIDSTDTGVAYKYAESCRLNHNHEQAAIWYAKIAESQYAKPPLLYFHLGSTLKSIGKYKRAKTAFSAFLKEKNNLDSFYIKKAKHEVIVCEKTSDIILSNNGSNYIDITQLSRSVNSVWSEFSSLELNDSTLLFTSLRPVAQDTNRFMAQLFESRINNDNRQSAEAITELIVSNELMMADIAYDYGRKILYFTACDSKNANDCKIYRTKKSGDNWQAPELLPKKINLPGTRNKQPAIAEMSDGKRVLLFVSDRRGGKGKLDIWFCPMNAQNEFGEVKNMGEIINSIDNEVTPFFDYTDSTLYFSSAWHENIGGFDIFKSKGDFHTWTKPQNIGIPVNSSYDDVYFSMNYWRTKAYFTSNRETSYSYQNKTCCNDIYSYQLPRRDTFTMQIDTDKETEIELVTRRLEQMDSITVYFHDNIPNPGSRKTTTETNYRKLYYEYAAMEGKYREEYSENMALMETKQAQKRITQFFINDVQQGFRELTGLMASVRMLLDSGLTVTVTVKGFTSPLGSFEYNQSLAQRRIESIVNYLNIYGDGELKVYKEMGKLKIRREIFGEKTAPEYVSDDPRNKQKSIYSPEAALERRVQIIVHAIE